MNSKRRNVMRKHRKKVRAAKMNRDAQVQLQMQKKRRVSLIVIFSGRLINGDFERFKECLEASWFGSEVRVLEKDLKNGYTDATLRVKEKDVEFVRYSLKEGGLRFWGDRLVEQNS